MCLFIRTTHYFDSSSYLKDYIQGVFFTGLFIRTTHTKKLKYGKPRLGESMLTQIILDTPYIQLFASEKKIQEVGAVCIYRNMAIRAPGTADNEDYFDLKLSLKSKPNSNSASNHDLKQ